MTELSPDNSFRFTGWHMWGLAIAFFGVIIGVNVFLAVASARSWTGMVVEDSYIAGQQFETERKAHEAQVRAGWTPTFEYISGTARLRVVDGAGNGVDIGSVTLLINRPVGGHEDQTLNLARQTDGTYQAAISLPTGAWDATVAADETALGPFRLERRFYVGSDR